MSQIFGDNDLRRPMTQREALEHDLRTMRRGVGCIGVGWHGLGGCRSPRGA